MDFDRVLLAVVLRGLTCVELFEIQEQKTHIRIETVSAVERMSVGDAKH